MIERTFNIVPTCLGPLQMLIPWKTERTWRSRPWKGCRPQKKEEEFVSSRPLLSRIQIVVAPSWREWCFSRRRLIKTKAGSIFLLYMLMRSTYPMDVITQRDRSSTEHHGPYPVEAWWAKVTRKGAPWWGLWLVTKRPIPTYLLLSSLPTRHEIHRLK
jgi:hypothetical protein